MLRLHIYAFILAKQVEKKKKKKTVSEILDKWNIICTDRWDNKYNKSKVSLDSIHIQSL